ncbi:thermonuclease family protein [Bacillaceae bacterium CLA-AA-H227]|uniref:Thermonuclease family protein n=1 Tax=Robertmurraya yapensis (ex Hitch et al 2024) TaxID=3133160 RepID=A0ACC6SGG8_9BACI
MKFKLAFIVSIILLIVSGCSESSIIEEATATRDKFSNRVDSSAEDKTENKNISVREGHWYTWSIPNETRDYKAPDKTKLIEGKVVNVVDGDTLDIQITNGKEERVRLILVDTPESKGDYEDKPQPYAIEAYEFTKELLQDRTVWLEIDKEERDQYERLLAYIWLDDVVMNQEVLTKDDEVVIIGEKIGQITLNELLLREGLAEVAVFPPNNKYEKQFEDVQKQAKKEEEGIWK